MPHGADQADIILNTLGVNRDGSAFVAPTEVFQNQGEEVNAE